MFALCPLVSLSLSFWAFDPLLQRKNHRCSSPSQPNLQPTRSILVVLGLIRFCLTSILPTDNLIRHIHALCPANLLRELDRRRLTFLVAGVFQTARDAVDELAVGADAADVELTAVRNLVAGGVVFEAGFLWDVVN